MMLVCTSSVADRFDGFLRSVLLNVHPGIYISEQLDTGSRERIWSILSSWWEAYGYGTILMIYTDSTKPMGVDFRSLGAPKRRIAIFEGIYVLEHLKENTDNTERKGEI